MKLLILLFISSVILLNGCSTVERSSCDDTITGFARMAETPKLQLSFLDAVPRQNMEREALTFQAFRSLGCSTVRSRLRRDRSSNIICTIEGTSARELLIAAHHDSLGSGHGIADNWTGVSVLLSLARYYQRHQPMHTLKLVAFADEEDDLKGASQMVRRIRKGELARPRAVINVDTIGIDELALDYRSDASLACVAKSSAAALGLALDTRKLEDMSGDSLPFKQIGIPTLHFHSLNAQTIRYLHTYRDKRERVDDKLLTQAFNVIASTISALDHRMDLEVFDPQDIE